MNRRADPLPKIVFLAIFVAVVLAAGWMALAKRDTETANRGTFGGPAKQRLNLSDDWQASGDHWPLQANPVSWRLRDALSLTPSTLPGLGGALSVKMPDWPGAVASRRDIFRLDLTVSVSDGENKPARIDAGVTLIPVRDGGCVRPNEGDGCALTLASPLKGPAFGSVETVGSDDVEVRPYMVRWLEPETESEVDFAALPSRDAADKRIGETMAVLSHPVDMEIAVDRQFFRLGAVSMQGKPREGRFVAGPRGGAAAGLERRV